MRVFVLCVLSVTLLVGSVTANPKKKKFEGDFEFAEDSVAELKSKDVKDRKTWISDPTSDLCLALKCRKDERCLLEDSFTAVCVSKAELRRNGDLVVSKTKFDSTSTTAKPADYDDEDDEYDEDDDDANEGPDSSGAAGRGNNNIDDDLGLEFYDLDINVDEDGGLKKKTKSITTTTTPKYAILKRCNPCPVVKPTYMCGTNNMTFSSLCKLDYYNCMNDAQVQVACKGFCPCPSQSTLKKNNKEMRLADFERKYKATVDKETLKLNKDARIIFSPEVSKFKEELFGKNKVANKKAADKNNKWAKNSVFSAEDKEKELGFNDVLPEKKTADFAGCNEAAMETMGNRLLDWFSVLMSQPKNAKQQKSLLKTKGHFPATCAKEVKWMFSYLDSDSNSQLSLAELYDMEHNERESCLKPFIDRCDENRDVFLSTSEWCRCFSKAERPCQAVRRRTKGALLGSFVPRCDGEGFYQPLQCHGATGTCWCVDSHGVEQTGSRTRGRPDCESILKKNGVNKKEGSEDEDLDNSDEVEESSGDGGTY